MRHKLTITAVLLLIATGGAFWWGGGRAPEAEGRPPTDRRHRLLRPLAHRLDARFLGALAVPPRMGQVTDVGTVGEQLAGQPPVGQQIMVELEGAAADALRAHGDDVGALVDFARRVLWLGHWARSLEKRCA
jgi:hypothetical protein